MNRILISRSNDLLRVARIDGQTLYDLEIEPMNNPQTVDSICNAEVLSNAPSLNAVFVKYDETKRNGFLSVKEIAPELRSSGSDFLFEGQKILVQVNKEERGSKGAAVSTFISLAGCYLVLMPNNSKAGGISRRIEGDERDELKQAIEQLNIPHGMGVIVRTAGIGKSSEELQWDLDVLIKLWDAIQEASKQHGAPYLIHQESDIAIRAVRDHLRQDISEILVDDEEIFKRVCHYIERVRPDFIDRVKLYADKLPLFSRFQLEKQIESAYQRTVRLPSGGEIVIDRSEALIAIDVNSAKATKGGDIEETALNTNLEAADEIAKQLRIRDLAGLIVIDFIDMDRPENQYKVEDRMRDALKNDRARIQLARLSRFGLLEMSRQRLRPTLSEDSMVVCPRCHGQGSIRNVQSQAESILHLIEEEACKNTTGTVRVQLPVELATYMLNERRNSIIKIESLSQSSVIVIANPYLETPQYQIESISGSKTEDESTLSYEMVSKPVVEYVEDSEESKIKKQHAAVGDILPDSPAPITQKPQATGLLVRLCKHLFGEKKSDSTNSQSKNSKSSGRDSRRPDRSDRYSQRNSRRRPRRSSSGAYRSNRRDDKREDSQTKDSRMNRDTREIKNPRETKDARGTRETTRAPSKNSRDNRNNRNTRNEGADNRNNNQRHPRRENNRERNRNDRKPYDQNRREDHREKPTTQEKVSALQPSKQEPVPVKQEIVTQSVRMPEKAAPRYAHTPKPITQTANECNQVETVHQTSQHERFEKHEVSLGRPRKEKPITKASPEEFEMVETKK